MPDSTWSTAAHTHAGDKDCANCSLNGLCLPQGLSVEDMTKLDSLVHQHQYLARGDYLYRAGDKFHAIFAVHRGFLKTQSLSEDGREQITGFYMEGEMLGVHAMGAGEYLYHATALEDSDICVIPFANLERLMREIPALQRNFHRLISREIVRDRGVMMLLGNMKAEERLAAFLLNLSQRLVQRGLPGNHFKLPMTREEIGNYLGMKLETVSRTFTRLHEAGLIENNKKQITLKDPAGLQAVQNGAAL